MALCVKTNRTNQILTGAHRISLPWMFDYSLASWSMITFNTRTYCFAWERICWIQLPLVSRTILNISLEFNGMCCANHFISPFLFNQELAMKTWTTFKIQLLLCWPKQWVWLNRKFHRISRKVKTMHLSILSSFSLSLSSLLECILKYVEFAGPINEDFPTSIHAYMGTCKAAAAAPPSPASML